MALSKPARAGMELDGCRRLFKAHISQCQLEKRNWRERWAGFSPGIGSCVWRAGWARGKPRKQGTRSQLDTPGQDPCFFREEASAVLWLSQALPILKDARLTSKIRF